MSTTYNDPVNFAAAVTFGGTVVFPPASIGDSQINPAAPLAVTKVGHQYMPKLAQVYGVAATAERRVVHRAKSAGTVAAFWFGLTVANVGAATVTADLLKNGTSVLSAPVVLNSATVIFVAVSGIVVTAAYIAGDVFEVSITVAAGGGTLGQGAFAEPTLTEAA